MQTRFHIRRKLFTLMVCLIFSTFLWLLNDLNKLQATTIHVPVRFTGLPYDMVPTNSLPTTMEASVEATGFRLLWRHFFHENETVEIPLKLDQLNLQSKKNYLFNLNYYTEEISQALGTNIRIKKIFPDTFSLQLEKKFVKKVPVKLDADLDFKKEFNVSGKIKLDPDSVVISGVQNKVDAVNYVYTSHLSLKDLSKNYTGKAQLAFINGISYSVDDIGVNIPVDRVTEKTVSIKVTPVDVPSNFELNVIPDQVKVKFLVPISGFKSVSADQFIITAPFPDLKQKPRRIILKITEQPDFVNVIEIDPVSVEFIITSKD